MCPMLMNVGGSLIQGIHLFEIICLILLKLGAVNLENNRRELSKILGTFKFRIFVIESTDTESAGKQSTVSI